MIENPFTCGGPITEPARFSGRQSEAREVFSRLGNMESSSVLGERCIGKTSFLRYISHASTVRKFGLDPNEYLFIFVDLQGYDRQETSDGFWRDVLDEIEAQAKDDRLKNTVAETRTRPSLGARELGDLIDNTGRQGQGVVLLLDEFEHVTSNPNFNQDFFSSLRYLATNHHLALITSSRQELVELFPSKELDSSPFFNIFAVIGPLGLLTPDEADELMDKALASSPVTFDQVDRKYLRQMTGCQPLFLQIAGYFLFEAYTRQVNPKERHSFVIEECRGRASSHFANYWDQSDDDERIILAALAQLNIGKPEESFDLLELKQLTGHSERIFRRLTRRGLLLRVGEKYRLFSPLLGEWITHEVLEKQGEDGART